MRFPNNFNVTHCVNAIATYTLKDFTISAGVNTILDYPIPQRLIRELFQTPITGHRYNTTALTTKH